MTDKSTLEALQDTAVAETAADGSKIVSVSADALAAHFSNYDLGKSEATVSVDDDPLFQQMFAELDEDDGNDELIASFFEDLPKG